MAARITPRQYDLLLTRSQKFVVVLPVLMLILAPVFFISGYSMANDPGFSKDELPIFLILPIVFFLGFAIFYGWSVATLPYRITSTSDQRLNFKTLLNVRTVRVLDLISIEPQTLRIKAGVSGYLIKHRDGKILIPGQFTGFYILLAELKNAIPAFDIREC